MSDDYETRKVEGGYDLMRSGKVLVHLTGTEGSLKASFPSSNQRDGQKCFDDCFAASDGTLGASHKCAKQCGLT
jgi:hypothetical protein